MYLAGIREIQVESSGMDVSYLLPPRPLGKLRWLGVFLVGFSVLFVWSPAHGVFDAVERLVDTQQAGFESIFVLGQLFFVVVGSFPGWLGLLMLFGRCRVDWREHRLSAAECLGPIRWRRRLPREPIQRLKVDLSRETESNQPLRRVRLPG